MSLNLIQRCFTMQNKDIDLSKIITTDEQKSFESRVERYYPNSDDNISNGSIEHAKVLVAYLFRYAIEKGQDVRMVTGHLEKTFYELFTPLIENILKHNKVSIISERNYDSSSFSDAIISADKGEIKIIGENNNIKHPPHFILVGEQSYRLETDDNLKLATASFNDPNIGKYLLGVFNRI